LQDRPSPPTSGSGHDVHPRHRRSPVRSSLQVGRPLEHRDLLAKT
jgi:hypothetical protein